MVEDSIREGIYDMPHFVEYAIGDVITHFLEQRGSPTPSRTRPPSKTRFVRADTDLTTVDPDIQHTVEQSLANWSYYPGSSTRPKQRITYKGGRLDLPEVKQPQAAAVVLDQHNGQIKAISSARATSPSR